MTGSTRHTVLVVDDDPAIRKVLSLGLERLGFTVRLASNGQEALDLLTSAGLDPDCVLLDIRMPILSGKEALPKIRGLFPLTPVIMLTVLRHPGERLLQFADNALNQYLTKPFDPLTLRGHIDRMLGQPGLWPTPSASFRSVLGVLNEAAEALDLDRRYEPPKAANTDSETP